MSWAGLAAGILALIIANTVVGGVLVFFGVGLLGFGFAFVGGLIGLFARNPDGETGRWIAAAPAAITLIIICVLAYGFSHMQVTF
jgi:hypothetical protein